MDSAALPMLAQRNAKAQQDAFADLASWTNSMKKKDDTVRSKELTGKKVLEKVRSKRQKHVVVVDSDGSEGFCLTLCGQFLQLL